MSPENEDKTKIKKRKILENKFYLYLTEFFAGMSVMAVELGASRLLAPFFSSSQIVWTIIIGTIMIAMALGNIYGGRAADKNPDPDRLYRRVMIAAVWIAFIPVLGKYIIVGISALLILSVNSGFLIIAAFAACMIVFVFPLFLLGTVTPSLVKYTVDSLDDSGKTVGNLNASNTIGSIIGTFVPTFISIPAVGTAVTFLIFSGILLMLCLIYFFSGKKAVPTVGTAVSALLFLICCIFGHGTSFAFWEKNLTFEGESVYNYLQVYENEDEVVLSTNVLFGVQSVYVKEPGPTGMYYDYAMAAPYMAGVREKDELSVLVLGMGSGTYSTQLSRYFDNVTVEGVEIDEKITKLARKYFNMPDSVKVTTYDGRAFLNATDKKYDVIMVDAYQDITIPFQMSSKEFFKEVKDHLSARGVMVVNMNMRGGGKDSITTYLSDTISAVFDNVYTVDVKGSTNRELFAADFDLMEAFEKNLGDESNDDLLGMMGKVREGIEKYSAGKHVMTDDKAPVELLGMKVIDEIIKEEIKYYKEVYKEKGLSGLIDSL
ncbi:MAG: fused MFS/spermidine synthase [Lachnospiraceae bacterium]|nr:fused MFS/spermidine synthase [Lachnospiraceae bacterium]